MQQRFSVCVRETWEFISIDCLFCIYPSETGAMPGYQRVSKQLGNLTHDPTLFTHRHTHTLLPPLPLNVRCLYSKLQFSSFKNTYRRHTLDSSEKWCTRDWGGRIGDARLWFPDDMASLLKSAAFSTRHQNSWGSCTVTKAPGDLSHLAGGSHPEELEELIQRAVTWQPAGGGE